MVIGIKNRILSVYNWAKNKLSEIGTWLTTPINQVNESLNNGSYNMVDPKALTKVFDK
jgi:hypothetical protein